MERVKRKCVLGCRLDLTECQVAKACKRGKQASDAIKSRTFLTVV